VLLVLIPHLVLNERRREQDNITTSLPSSAPSPSSSVTVSGATQSAAQAAPTNAPHRSHGATAPAVGVVMGILVLSISAGLFLWLRRKRMADGRSNEREEKEDDAASYGHVMPSQPQVPTLPSVRKPRMLPIPTAHSGPFPPQSIHSSQEPEPTLSAVSTVTAVNSPVKARPRPLPAINIAASTVATPTSATSDTLHERIHNLEARIEQMAILANPPAYDASQSTPA
jgi:hypothetical protein